MCDAFWRFNMEAACSYKVLVPVCSLHYIYFSQHNYIIKAWVKATCFDLKSHRQTKLSEAIPPPRYTGTEALSLLHEEAVNRLTEKLTRQDSADPKQKAVTDYKEQVDRHHHLHPTPSTGN